MMVIEISRAWEAWGKYAPTARINGKAVWGTGKNFPLSRKPLDPDELHISEGD